MIKIKMGLSNSKSYTACGKTYTARSAVGPKSVCNRCYHTFCDQCMYVKTCFKTGVCKKCLAERVDEINNRDGA